MVEQRVGDAQALGISKLQHRRHGPGIKRPRPQGVGRPAVGVHPQHGRAVEADARQREAEGGDVLLQRRRWPASGDAEEDARGRERLGGGDRAARKVAVGVTVGHSDGWRQECAVHVGRHEVQWVVGGVLKGLGDLVLLATGTLTLVEHIEAASDGRGGSEGGFAHVVRARAADAAAPGKSAVLAAVVTASTRCVPTKLHVLCAVS